MANVETSRASDRTVERPVQRLQRPGHATSESRFAVDLNKLPRDMDVNWKRVSVFGLEDKRNQIICAQNHWQPVTHEMQPHILGHLGKPGQPIIVDGQMLMIRPKYLSEEAEKERNQETDYQTQQQLQSLRLASKEQVGERFTKIKKTFERGQPVE